jgi:hypothetical protein
VCFCWSVVCFCLYFRFVRFRVWFRCSSLPCFWSLVTAQTRNKKIFWVVWLCCFLGFYVIHGVVVSVFVCVCMSFVMSSIGFGGGVVAIVQPIHAPIAKMAMTPIRTGVAISQNCTFATAASPVPKMASAAKLFVSPSVEEKSPYIEYDYAIMQANVMSAPMVWSLLILYFRFCADVVLCCIFWLVSLVCSVLR